MPQDNSVQQPIADNTPLKPGDNQSGGSSRIAKNAVMLYLRMFLGMLVGFYTSRVVLDVLGVADYGIYGVVSGVVAMWGFLNASMSGATSRFLTFELGLGDKKRLAETFSSALIVHIGIALVVFVLAETIGLWFLYNKLVIPADRMTAAFWVYQLSIVGTMVSITQVPYDASIISHERMDIYAYVEILNSVLKLLIVYLLTIGGFDKLILYAALVFAVTVLIMMIYRVYCIRHYEETHFHWIWKPAILKPLLSFSGWDLYGNGCVAVRQQGFNFLINMFFGVIYNAASGITSVVNGLILGLVGNITLAYRPAIIKRYAQEDLGQMQVLMKNAVKVMIMLYGCLMVPCFMELPYLLSLWLVTVPEYTVIFCRLMFLASFMILVNNVISIAIHATGDIKRISFISGTTHVVCVLVVYVLFRLGMRVETAYIAGVVFGIIIMFSNTAILKVQIKRFEAWKFLQATFISFIIIAVAAVAAAAVHTQIAHPLVRLIVVTSVSLVTILVINYVFIIDQASKDLIASKLWRRFR